MYIKFFMIDDDFRCFIYFLQIGVLLFFSNIGSEYFIGLVGSGVVSGIVVVVFEWGVCYEIF